MIDLDSVLAAFLDDPDPGVLGPAGLRLARELPEVQAALDGRVGDPLERALLGVGPVPQETELGRAVLAALATVDGGGVVADAAALEARAEGDATWWVPAAWVHARCDPARDQAGRMRLSEQSLPYVFPGELDQITVDVIAVGERVMPALHVDWARKLTVLAADALVLDCRALGLWFWPVLRSLSTERLGKPVGKLIRARRMPPGGLGLAAAYAHRVGAPVDPLLAKGGPVDHLLAALAIIGDRSR